MHTKKNFLLVLVIVLACLSAHAQKVKDFANRAGMDSNDLFSVSINAGSGTRHISYGQLRSQLLKTNLSRLSVKEFGAVGDGVANDSIAVSNTFYHANLYKRTVFFPAGTYLDNNCYYLDGSRVSIEGEDVFGSIWKLQQTTNSVAIAINTALPRIENLTLEGPGKWTRNVSGLTVTNALALGYWGNVVLKEWGKFGADLQAMCRLTLEQVYATDNGIGIRLAGYSDGAVGALGLDRNLIGLWIGGVSSPGLGGVDRVSGAKIHVVGNHNFVGVVVGRGAANNVSGYMEQNTNDFWMGFGPTNAWTHTLYDLASENPSYVQQVKLSDFASLGYSIAGVVNTTNVAVWTPTWGLQLENYSASTSTQALVQVVVNSDNVGIDFDNVGQYNPLVQWYDGTTASGTSGNGTGYGIFARFAKGPMKYFDVAVSKTRPAMSYSGTSLEYSNAASSLTLNTGLAYSNANVAFGLSDRIRMTGYTEINATNAEASRLTSIFNLFTPHDNPFIPQMLIGSDMGTNTAKSFRIAWPSFANGLPTAVLYGYSSSSAATRLYYGGGTGSMHPVAGHQFYSGDPSAYGAGTLRMTVDSAGVIFNSVSVPASAAAAGTAGQFAYDANYIYMCTAANTWKRVAIATW